MNKFPIMGNLCCVHRCIKSEEEVVIENVDDSNDSLYVSLPGPSTSNNSINEFLEYCNVDISPVKFQVNSTPIPNLSSSSFNYHKRKYMEAMKSFQTNYVKNVVAGQEAAFLEDIKKERCTEINKSAKEMKFIVDAFDKADTSKQKISIISFIHNKRRTWCELF